jgi:hypothetical protein
MTLKRSAGGSSLAANAASVVEVINEEEGFGTHAARLGDLVLVHYTGK